MVGLPNLPAIENGGLPYTARLLLTSAVQLPIALSRTDFAQSRVKQPATIEPSPDLQLRNIDNGGLSSITDNSAPFTSNRIAPVRSVAEQLRRADLNNPRGLIQEVPQKPLPASNQLRNTGPSSVADLVNTLNNPVPSPFFRIAENFVPGKARFFQPLTEGALAVSETLSKTLNQPRNPTELVTGTFRGIDLRNDNQPEEDNSLAVNNQIPTANDKGKQVQSLQQRSKEAIKQEAQRDAAIEEARAKNADEQRRQDIANSQIERADIAAEARQIEIAQQAEQRRQTFERTLKDSAPAEQGLFEKLLQAYEQADRVDQQQKLANDALERQQKLTQQQATPVREGQAALPLSPAQSNPPPGSVLDVQI